MSDVAQARRGERWRTDRRANVLCIGKLALEAWLGKQRLGMSWLMFNHQGWAGGSQTEIP